MSLKKAREVLGVSQKAGPGEVRRAFREAAKRAHPDRPGGNPERFRQVVDAYHLLQTSSSERAAARDTVIQPPARTERAAPQDGRLSIPPLIALNGGKVEHRLTDGRLLNVSLPAGMRTGDKVRLDTTELEVAVRGDGDLLVRGNDVWISVSLDPAMLAEGGRIAVDSPLGRKVIWVDRKAGERGLVRLEGQGLPARGRHRQGHLFFRLAPATGKVDSAARTLLRRFAAAWAA